jgi:TonB family protein
MISIDFLRPPGSSNAPVDDPEQDQLWVSRMLAQQLSKPKQRIASQPYAQNTAPTPTFHALTLLLDGAYVMNLVPSQAYGKTLNAVRIAGLSDSTSQLLSRLPLHAGDIWSPASAGVVNQIVKDFAPGLEADIVKDPASQISTLWIGPSLPALAGRAASYADVTPPAVIVKVDPVYTDSAKRAGTSGTVVLALTVSPDGTAQDVRVVSPLDPGLDAAAMSVVPRWRFKPGEKNGVPVAVPAQIDFTFRVL